MTHLPDRFITPAKMNIYHTASATVSVGSYVSWSTQATSGHDFTLTHSGDTFTIPSDGHTYILEASLAPYTSSSLSSDGVSFIWEIDGTEEGNIGLGLVTLNDAETVMAMWGDERARAYARPSTSVSAKLKIKTIHGVAPSGVDSTNTTWASRARVVIWKI